MSRADIHQFGWPNSELIMPISRVNRPQSRGWFDYKRGQLSGGLYLVAFVEPLPGQSTPPLRGPVLAGGAAAAQVRGRLRLREHFVKILIPLMVSQNR